MDLFNCIMHAKHRRRRPSDSSNKDVKDKERRYEHLLSLQHRRLIQQTYILMREEDDYFLLKTWFLVVKESLDVRRIFEIPINADLDMIEHNYIRKLMQGSTETNTCVSASDESSISTSVKPSVFRVFNRRYCSQSSMLNKLSIDQLRARSRQHTPMNSDKNIPSSFIRAVNGANQLFDRMIIDDECNPAQIQYSCWCLGAIHCMYMERGFHLELWETYATCFRNVVSQLLTTLRHKYIISTSQQERANQAWSKMLELILMCMRSGYQHHQLLQL